MVKVKVMINHLIYAKENSTIVLLILIVPGGIAATGSYIGKKLAQPQEESFTPPSIEPEEITQELLLRNPGK